MFGDVGKQLLNIMGQSGMVPGAIRAEDVGQALALLESGINKNPQNPQNPLEENDEEREISLSHRALPLISMLQEAKKHQCNVMWE